MNETLFLTGFNEKGNSLVDMEEFYNKECLKKYEIFNNNRISIKTKKTEYINLINEISTNLLDQYNIVYIRTDLKYLTNEINKLKRIIGLKTVEYEQYNYLFKREYKNKVIYNQLVNKEDEQLIKNNEQYEDYKIILTNNMFSLKDRERLLNKIRDCYYLLLKSNKMEINSQSKIYNSLYKELTLLKNDIITQENINEKIKTTQNNIYKQIKNYLFKNDILLNDFFKKAKKFLLIKYKFYNFVRGYINIDVVGNEIDNLITSITKDCNDLKQYNDINKQINYINARMTSLYTELRNLEIELNNINDKIKLKKMTSKKEEDNSSYLIKSNIKNELIENNNKLEYIINEKNKNMLLIVLYIIDFTNKIYFSLSNSKIQYKNFKKNHYYKNSNFYKFFKYNKITNNFNFNFNSNDINNDKNYEILNDVYFFKFLLTIFNDFQISLYYILSNCLNLYEISYKKEDDKLVNNFNKEEFVDFIKKYINDVNFKSNFNILYKQTDININKMNKSIIRKNDSFLYKNYINSTSSADTSNKNKSCMRLNNSTMSIADIKKYRIYDTTKDMYKTRNIKLRKNLSSVTITKNKNGSEFNTINNNDFLTKEYNYEKDYDDCPEHTHIVSDKKLKFKRNLSSLNLNDYDTIFYFYRINDIRKLKKKTIIQNNVDKNSCIDNRRYIEITNLSKKLKKKITSNLCIFPTINPKMEQKIVRNIIKTNNNNINKNNRSNSISYNENNLHNKKKKDAKQSSHSLQKIDE